MTRLQRSEGGVAVASDDQLLARLRDLVLVDIDALLAGVDAAEQAALVVAYAADLHEALRRAQDRFESLVAGTGGRRAFAVVELSPAQRGEERAAELAARSQAGLATRAVELRMAACMAEPCGQLLPRLIDAERRR